MSETEIPVKKIHVNVPQLLYAIVQAQVSVLIWGRATGKSEGPGALFTINNIHSMPRSNGLIMGTTYEQILTRTLPPLIAVWEKWGYRENEHFWIRKFAPANLKLDKAYRHPVTADHYIHWYNGSGIYLVSQDRPGTINGVRSQWCLADEAKFLNKKKFDTEAIPTMAGHAELFGHLSNYLSKLFMSDMPTTSGQKWLLDYEQQMDREAVELIIKAMAKVVKLQEELSTLKPIQRAQNANRIKRLLHDINELRRGTVYFSEASTLENIHVLGVDAIKEFKRVMNEWDFRVSILNERILRIENGFYSNLDPDKHGYSANNYAYIDTLPAVYRGNANRDCRWDADLSVTVPLEIACDYNNAINCIVTGQEMNNHFRLLSSIFVKHPHLLNDCVKKWHDYYKYHPNKDVIYWYDSTAKKRSSRTDITDSDEWAMELEKLGWSVIRKDIGQIGSHKSRYLFWGRLLKGDDKRLPVFSYNRDNAYYWQVSASQAGVIRKADNIEKDKRSERHDSGVPAEESTHISEAADVLLYGKYRDRFDDSSTYLGIINS
jgi:hypothetical protein